MLTLVNYAGFVLRTKFINSIYSCAAYFNVTTGTRYRGSDLTLSGATLIHRVDWKFEISRRGFNSIRAPPGIIERHLQKVEARLKSYSPAQANNFGAVMLTRVLSKLLCLLLFAL